MRRLGLVLLLPLFWVPMIALALTVGPMLPVWSWVVAVAFVVLMRRRIRAAAAGQTEVPADAVDGPRWGARSAGF